MDNQNNEQAAQYQGLCPECQAGVMNLEYVTFFTWLNDELVSVPNFPAWVCDVCGRREYDARALTWLNTLLNHDLGRRARVRTRRRPGAAPSNRPLT